MLNKPAILWLWSVCEPSFEAQEETGGTKLMLVTKPISSTVSHTVYSHSGNAVNDQLQHRDNLSPTPVWRMHYSVVGGVADTIN